MPANNFSDILTNSKNNNDIDKIINELSSLGNITEILDEFARFENTDAFINEFISKNESYVFPNPTIDKIIKEFEDLEISLSLKSSSNISPTEDCKIINETFFPIENEIDDSCVPTILPSDLNNKNISPYVINANEQIIGQDINPNLLSELEDTLIKNEADQMAELNALKDCLFSNDPKATTVQSICDKLKSDSQDLADKKYLLDTLIEYTHNADMFYEFHKTRYTYYMNLYGEYSTLRQNIKTTENDINKISDQINISIINKNNSTIQSDIDIYTNEVNTLTIEKDKLTSNMALYESNAIQLMNSSIFNSSSQSFKTYYDTVSGDLTGQMNIKKSNLKTDLSLYSSSIKYEDLGTNTGNMFSYSIDFIKLFYILNPDTSTGDVIMDSFIDTSKNKPNNTGSKNDNIPYVLTSKNLKNRDVFKSFPEIEYDINLSPKDTSFSGILYQDYYKKLNDPLNNFFTAQERGLTSSINDALIVDITGSEKLSINPDPMKVKQGENDYYVQNQEIFNSFFSDKDFENKLSNKISQYFDLNIKPIKEELINKFKELASLESKYYLLKYVNNENVNPEISNSKKFIDAYESLQSEILTLKQEIQDVKSNMDPDKIRSQMKDIHCISSKLKNYTEEPPPGVVIDEIGSLQSLTGTDPLGPNNTKHCYWLKFAGLATLYGLLPFPEYANPASLRYWPVGMIIPTPAGILKIPLPIIWVPLITISNPMGTIVVFLGQAGIMPCPYVLFISNDGKKTFILTLYGIISMFDEFGHGTNDGNIMKDWFNVPFIDTFKIINEIDKGIKTIDQLDPTSLAKFNMIKGHDKFKFPDEVEKIKIQVIKKISNAGLPKLDLHINKASVKKSIEDFINDIKMPIIKIPDLGKYKKSSAVEEAIEDLKKIIEFNPKLPDLVFINLKQMLKKEVSGLFDNVDLQKELLSWPDKLIFSPDEVDNLNRIKKITTKALKLAVASLALSDIVYNNLALDSLGNITLENPFDCGTKPITTNIKMPTLSIIEAAVMGLYALIDNMDFNFINNLLKSLTLKTSQVMSFLLQIIESIIPELLLPIDFDADYFKLMKATVMGLIPGNIPKLKPSDLLAFLPKGLIIDTNIFKQPIISSIEGIILPLIDNYNTLTSIQLKYLIIDTIDKLFSTSEAFIKQFEPIYNAITIIINTAKNFKRLLKFDKNPMDMAMNAVKTLADIVLALIPDLTGLLKFGDLFIFSQFLLGLAFSLLKSLKALNFVVIALMCSSMGNKNARLTVSRLHPVLNADDLPPYERLSLNNFLFCLFLDEFCNFGKKYGGLGENFL